MRPIATGAKLIGLILSVLVTTSGAIIGGVMLDRLVLADFVPLQNVQKAAEPDFKLMSEAWGIISKKYVDRQAVQPQNLTYGAISGMVNALGDTGHSTFLSPEMLGIESHFLQGNFSGIGAQVKIKEGHIVILAPGIPLVVLVKGGSASSSEIVAGALKDAHRARLVGEKTFGAGTVLQEFGLSDGSAMLLAIAEWITPAGHVIWHKGVTPDVEVSLPVAAIPLYPDREKGMNSAALKASADTQLLRALDLLEHPESG